MKFLLLSFFISSNAFALTISCPLKDLGIKQALVFEVDAISQALNISETIGTISSSITSLNSPAIFNVEAGQYKYTSTDAKLAKRLGLIVDAKGLTTEVAISRISSTDYQVETAVTDGTVQSIRRATCQDVSNDIETKILNLKSKKSRLTNEFFDKLKLKPTEEEFAAMSEQFKIELAKIEQEIAALEAAK